MFQFSPFPAPTTTRGAASPARTYRRPRLPLDRIPLKCLSAESMPLLFDFVPRDEPSLHSQSTQTHVTDAEFEAAFAPIPVTFSQRILQILFFVTLGWIRLVLLLVFNCVFLLIHQPFIPFSKQGSLCQWVAMRIGAVYGRFMLFFLGLLWVRVKGKPDPKTRQFCYNHTSPFDGPLFYTQEVSTLAMMASIRKVPAYGRILASSSPLFIDRSSQCGNAERMKEGLLDKKRPPLALAPEAKLSNGTVVYKFRTGGFLSEEQFQPVTIRYYRLLPFVGCTTSWLCPTVWEFFWNLFAAPGFIAEVTFLDPVTPEEQKGKTPEEKAAMAQLAIANSLGTLAIDRSTKEYFQHHKHE
jgi:1-acyl-sn-glycerol-3-phosphate acyltransferase